MFKKIRDVRSIVDAQIQPRREVSLTPDSVRNLKRIQQHSEKQRVI